MKTNKSFTKRIRVTRRGKLVTRKIGQNHFNAKQSGASRMSRRKAGTIHLSKHARSRFLPGSPKVRPEPAESGKE